MVPYDQLIPNRCDRGCLTIFARGLYWAASRRESQQLVVHATFHTTTCAWFP